MYIYIIYIYTHMNINNIHMYMWSCTRTVINNFHNLHVSQYSPAVFGAAWLPTQQHIASKVSKLWFLPAEQRHGVPPQKHNDVTTSVAMEPEAANVSLVGMNNRKLINNDVDTYIYIYISHVHDSSDILWGYLQHLRGDPENCNYGDENQKSSSPL